MLVPMLVLWGGDDGAQTGGKDSADKNPPLSPPEVVSQTTKHPVEVGGGVKILVKPHEDLVNVGTEISADDKTCEINPRLQANN